MWACSSRCCVQLALNKVVFLLSPCSRSRCQNEATPREGSSYCDTIVSCSIITTTLNIVRHWRNPHIVAKTIRCLLTISEMLIVVFQCPPVLPDDLLLAEMDDASSGEEDPTDTAEDNVCPSSPTTHHGKFSHVHTYHQLMALVVQQERETLLWKSIFCLSIGTRLEHGTSRTYMAHAVTSTYQACRSSRRDLLMGANEFDPGNL